jgi:single-strand DNA-binding protein
MLNHIVLMGRLTRDPELRYTGSNTPVASFSLAVDRDFGRGENGERQTDFIDVVAWRQTGEFVSKYFQKGSRIGVSGSITTGSYQAQDGSKRYTTEVTVDNVEFVGSRSDGGGQSAQTAQTGSGQTNRNGTIPGIMQPPRNQQQRMDLTGQQDNGGFMEVDDDELPF